MKVLYDSQVFANQFYGGISRYFVELAKRLAYSDGMSVQVFAPFHINHYLSELDQEIVFGKQIRKSPRRLIKLLKLYNFLATRRRVNIVEPDILHETYFSRAHVALRYKQARVLTVYDMIHELYPESFSTWDRTARDKRVAVDRADHVICISENTRRDLLNILNVPSSKVSVVHLGFDSQQALEETPVTPAIQEPYLLYVGSREGYKNFPRLLEAYASSEPLHRDYRLVCFGGGCFTNSEKQLFRDLDLADDRVLWMGGSDAVLMGLYQHATAFLYPSLYEGFGIPPLEAMAHDCPVICSKGSSISEVVGHAGEFFDPHDSGEIACAIENVIGSPTRAEELRSSGRKRLKSFTWEKCAARTREVYSSLL
ncbi:MAG: glycosyltransferase family 1 protein [Xanthomonadales bacterium]|nr:glycosyltransferase family 1 protein [Xanthomonadales bacterium]